MTVAYIPEQRIETWANARLLAESMRLLRWMDDILDLDQDDVETYLPHHFAGAPRCDHCGERGRRGRLRHRPGCLGVRGHRLLAEWRQDVCTQGLLPRALALLGHLRDRDTSRGCCWCAGLHGHADWCPLVDLLASARALGAPS
ncbi:MAG TPA: hypothetical protein VGG07_14250 [Solirubrobacteraceae bacterium]|jgi:hypothetical protein